MQQQVALHRAVRRAGDRLRRPAARPGGRAAPALRRARRRRSTPRCSRGRRGRGAPTASGRRTGTRASRPRPASAVPPRVDGVPDLPDHLAPLAERCRPYYDELAAYRLAARGADVLQQFDERNRDLVVNVNGRLAPPRRGGGQPVRLRRPGRRRRVGGTAALPAAGSSRSTSTWPGCAARRRRWRSSEIPTDDEIVAQIRRTLAANDMTDGVHIRLTLTRGVKITSGMDPRLNRSGPDADRAGRAQAAGLRRPAASRLITSSMRRPTPDVLDPKIHQTTCSTRSSPRSRRTSPAPTTRCCSTSRGFVAETNATHLFFVLDGVLCTPTTDACPEGITRATVLRLAADAGIPTEVGDFPLAQLYTRRRGVRHRHDGRAHAGARRRRTAHRHR